MIGITTIKVKRGSQWDRSQTRGKGIRSTKRLKNDRYHCDQGEKRKPMG
jgi:hypothetical protein